MLTGTRRWKLLNAILAIYFWSSSPPISAFSAISPQAAQLNLWDASRQQCITVTYGDVGAKCTCLDTNITSDSQSYLTFQCKFGAWCDCAQTKGLNLPTILDWRNVRCWVIFFLHLQWKVIVPKHGSVDVDHISCGERPVTTVASVLLGTVEILGQNYQESQITNFYKCVRTLVRCVQVFLYPREHTCKKPVRKNSPYPAPVPVCLCSTCCKLRSWARKKISSLAS